MDVFLTVSLPFLHFHHTPPCYIHVGGTYSEGSEYFKQRSLYCPHTDEASGAQTASAGVEQAPRGHLTRRAAGSGERRQRRYRKEWFLMRPGKFMAWPSRLLLVALLGLLSALSVVVAGVSHHAHAAADATLTVTDCSGETGPGRIGTVISSASAGDTITFSCSGTIPITSTLSISKNLTLDGSGQTVTLDGGNSVRVLSV